MNRRTARGITLVELLVTLVIMAILAGVALPYAELGVKRHKELELREALREVRTALDRFHEDWRNGRISKLDEGVSADGYPKTLAVLVSGVDNNAAKKQTLYYLRRVPANPLAPTGTAPDRQWRLRSYQDAPGTLIWGGQDVYDLYSAVDGAALDGSKYGEW